MLQFEYESEQRESETVTVSELTRNIKMLLETTLPINWVEGEISNFVKHSSGHFYFSLKDDAAQIACVIWRNRTTQLFFTPQDGMKVIARGRVTVYEKRGNYQLDVQSMQPAGVGELQLAFEKLKNRLNEEGLFDPGFKKDIPKYPNSIGIITSPTGAAIRDIVHVIQRRFPAVELILRPTLVQGDGAAPDIVKAIQEFNTYAGVDVIILGRGGGSLEDLWAFNEESVARAIFESEIPIISAVGHEIDFSISDFVADLRAPTPSAAAEIAVPESREIKLRIQELALRMYRRMLETIRNNREKLNYIRQAYGFRRPIDLILQFRQRLDELNRAMETSMRHRIQLQREYFTSLTRRLDSLSPQAVLQRGYSICYKADTQEIIKDSGSLNMHDIIRVKLSRGQAWGDVSKLQNEN
ncbi:exodeoxyribonuclease VII large subunit [candidate division KSB1 bacterium]|nr:exodeoxyribonuclease VII large subunit [candidate division KSB1 bacterium]